MVKRDAMTARLALLLAASEARPAGTEPSCPMCGAENYTDECKRCGYGPQGLGALPELENSNG